MSRLLSATSPRRPIAPRINFKLAARISDWAQEQQLAAELAGNIADANQFVGQLQGELANAEAAGNMQDVAALDQMIAELQWAIDEMGMALDQLNGNLF